MRWKLPDRIPSALLTLLTALISIASVAQSPEAGSPQQPASLSTPAPALSVTSVITHVLGSTGYRDEATTDSPLRFGQDIRLHVPNLSAWINAGNSPWNLTLFLNERPMKGLHPVSVDEASGYLDFRLERLDENISAWNGLVEREKSWEWFRIARHMHASVGPEAGVAVPSKATFVMVFLSRAWCLFVIAAAVFTFGLLVILGRNSALLRSSAEGPYSLARTQMAVWSWLTLNAYFYLFALTSDPAVEIPVSVLGLLGISATTYVAAAMVDRAIPGQAPEASLGFWRDIAGGSQVSLHRLQMIGWTLVLSIAFIVDVLNNLSIPDFNPTLLGLLGLSAGTYVGFKFPEIQSSKPSAGSPSS